MKIIDLLVIVFGISMTSDYVYCGYNTVLSHDDIIRVKKSHEDSSSSSGYLEQCGIVTFPKARLGVVNVLAFLDSSWPYSHRQAVMLEMLNKRLQRSGLPDTLFFVVNVDPSFVRTIDAAEDDMEREAWLGVSPEEIVRPDIDKTSDSLAMRMTPDIQLIQDNENLGIWRELRGSRDQVLVIDRCGKLTYQVIVPWSILHFPYVKAAILSTYKDEPCGPCVVVNKETSAITENYDENVPVTNPLDTDRSFTTEEYFQNDRESITGSDAPMGTKNSPFIDENIGVFSVVSENFVPPTENEYENISELSTTDNSVTDSETNFTNGFNIVSNSKTTDNVIRDEDSDTTIVSSVTNTFFEDFTTPETEYVSTMNSYLQEEEILPVVVDTAAEEITEMPNNQFFSIENKSDDFYDNYSNILQDRVVENTEIEERPPLSDIAIRIIMHAPHFHVDGDSTRMHEYMVLKTDSSGYHGHLSSYDATRLYRGPQDFQEEQLNRPNDNIQEKQWSMKNVFYGKDESPGLYGEVADYWRGLENQESYNDAEETERPEEQIDEAANTEDEISKKPLKMTNDKIVYESPTHSTENSDTTAKTDFDSERVTVNQATNTEEFNPEEEETRNRLIAHYSKLLPWIYYVLDK